jgi:hypothetical protein
MQRELSALPSTRVRPRWRREPAMCRRRDGDAFLVVDGNRGFGCSRCRGRRAVGGRHFRSRHGRAGGRVCVLFAFLIHGEGVQSACAHVSSKVSHAPSDLRSAASCPGSCLPGIHTSLMPRLGPSESNRTRPSTLHDALHCILVLAIAQYKSKSPPCHRHSRPGLPP